SGSSSGGCDCCSRRRRQTRLRSSPPRHDRLPVTIARVGIASSVIPTRPVVIAIRGVTVAVVRWITVAVIGGIPVTVPVIRVSVVGPRESAADCRAKNEATQPPSPASAPVAGLCCSGHGNRRHSDRTRSNQSDQRFPHCHYLANSEANPPANVIRPEEFRNCGNLTVPQESTSVLLGDALPRP